MPEFKSNTLFPSEIVLEVTNVCNLRCRFCHFHSEQAKRRRKIEHMDKDLWTKVLQELEEWPRPVSLLTHGAGEPLLYPHLLDLLHQAKQIPDLRVGFMTNAMLLDAQWAKRLVDMQIDFLAFSIDGINPQTHDYFRRNANLQIIETNLSRLIHEKKEQGSQLPHLSFNMVGYEQILDQADGYVRKWLPHAQSVSIAKFRPVGSRILWDNHGQQPPFRPCPLLFNQLVIGVDGRVGLCCEDINLEVPVGKIQESSIMEIYNHSKDLKKYRQAHERQDLTQLPLCSDCHVWGGDIPLATELVTIDGVQAQKTTTHAFTSYQKVSSTA
ncbi:MAG: radical SAM protein [Desulfovermiculus sp.]